MLNASYTVYCNNTRTKNQVKEIQRRITAGWVPFAKHRDIYKKQPCHLSEETGVHLLCSASYGIWCRDRTLTKQALNKLAAARTEMEIRVCSTSHCIVSLEWFSFYVGTYFIYKKKNMLPTFCPMCPQNVTPHAVVPFSILAEQY